jgi:microcystin-dependent protein
MPAPIAPEAWVVPNNPSLTQTLRTTFESLRGWLRRNATYIADSITYATTLTVTTVDAAVPIGTVRMTVCFAAETGWLEMTGQTLTNAATTNPVFYSKVPSDWRSGNDIILPDFRNRFPITLAAGQVETDIGTLIGSNTTTLSVANLPAHSHPINLTTGTENQAHNHNPGSGAQFSNFTPFGGAQNFGAGGNAFPGSNTTNTENQAHNHNINSNTDGTGSGTAFATYPESMYIKFVVRII